MSDTQSTAIASVGSNSVKKKNVKKKLTPLEDTAAPRMFMSKSTSSIGHKRDLVEAIRRCNPASTNPAPNVFWDVEGNLKTSTIDDSSVMQQLCIVENGVNYSARKLNDLRVSNSRYANELKTKLDELESQKKAFEDLDSMKNAATTEGQRIEQLQVDIKAVENDIHRKIHYSRQLDYVLQRLRRNQIKFDAHMNGMEATMNQVDKESKEVRLLRRGLDSGLARAENVLAETQSKLAYSRKDREVRIAQRRADVNNAHQLQQWLVNRDKTKADLATTLRGDLTKDEELLLVSQLREKQDKTKNLQKANEDSHKLLQAMEEEFMLIKHVTGVSSLDEMLDKVSSQKPNKSNLESEVKEAEQKLVWAKKVSSDLENQFQELKSSGVGMADVSRDVTSQLETEINHARLEFKVTHASTERLSTVLVGLQQGATGLLQRVTPYMYMADSNVFDLTQIEEDAPWADTINALSSAEQILAKMMELCSGGDASPAKLPNEDEDDDAVNFDKTRMDMDEESPSFHGNNVRIVSKKAQRDSDMRVDLDVNNGDNDNEPSSAISREEEANAGNSARGASAGSDRQKEDKIVSSSSNNAAKDENAVKTRQGLKKDAARTSQDAVRKQEQDVRNKRLAEKMRTGEMDSSGIGAAARSRAQLQSANRLSTLSAVPTLPQGVTLRDDPMTKTKAFLTQLPDLV